VNQVFAATAALPLLVALTTILLDEPSTQLKSRHSVTWEDLMSQATLVWKAIQTREILLPVTFMTAWQASPSSGSAMFYFFTNELHFTPELLGRSQLSGAIASLVGIILYSKFFASVPIKDYLLKVNITAVLVGLLPLLLVTRMNLVWACLTRCSSLETMLCKQLLGSLRTCLSWFWQPGSVQLVWRPLFLPC